MELQDIKGLLETEINSKPGRGGCPLRKATGEERLSALIPWFRAKKVASRGRKGGYDQISAG